MSDNQDEQKNTIEARGEPVIRFKINGSAIEHDGDGDEPLLWVIRQRVGLKGTKYGCGAGLCGACTVHVDGRAKRSCMLPVSQLDGRAVTTIEGLSANGDHPVQRAWLEIDVPQCGYCQAGQIMTAADLLERIPNPSDDDIDRLQTNICRCGTYWRIRKAIHRAADLIGQEEER